MRPVDILIPMLMIGAIFWSSTGMFLSGGSAAAVLFMFFLVGLLSAIRIPWAWAAWFPALAMSLFQLQEVRGSWGEYGTRASIIIWIFLSLPSFLGTVVGLIYKKFFMKKREQSLEDSVENITGSPEGPTDHIGQEGQEI